MIKVLMICHGNICRSTMAEFVFKDMVRKAGLDKMFIIESAGTSSEEVGNPVHYGTRKKLREHNISCEGKRARQLVRSDYEKYDYLLGMDSYNVINTKRRVGKDDNKKIKRLLDFAPHPRDIADPWYTDNFDITYEDVVEGCTYFLSYLRKEYNI